MPAFTCKVIEICLEKLLFKSACLPACHIGIKLLDAASSACARNKVVSSVIVKEDGSIVVHTVQFNS